MDCSNIRNTLRQIPLLNTTDLCGVCRENGMLCRQRSFSRGEAVALEGEDCLGIGVVLSGSVEVQKILESGKVLTLDRLGVGHIFGEAVVFSSHHQYPATLTAMEPCEILYLNRPEILQLCAADPDFLSGLLSLLSDKILMLNRKITTLTQKSVRQKVVGFLLQEYQRQGIPMFRLELSRQAMADHLGLPRPSLSREMSALRTEGLIDFDGPSVKLLQIPLLEQCLFL